MALNTSLDHFFQLVGHDGSEVIFDGLSSPHNSRGIHLQEAIDVALLLGFSCTPIELMPASFTVPDGPTRQLLFPGGNWPRFARYLRGNSGVAECTTRSGRGHAVAFEAGVIHDPDHLTPFTWSREEMEARGYFTQRLWLVSQS